MLVDDTSSESNMAIESSDRRGEKAETVYNTLLTYKGRNDHGASIYVDNREGYLVNIGDQPLEDEQTLWANYKGIDT